jgi:hypothetical protein
MDRRGFLGVMSVFVLSACAAQGRGVPRGGSANLISAEQITAVAGTAYDVVRTYHPNWLRIRGPDSFARSGQVQVYFDGVRMGGVENLRGIATNGISYIRWYDGISAAATWGLDHGNGVIWVSSTPE